MADKILFVDDEENVLAAFRRQFRKEFDIETAQSGERGLEVLTSYGPFSVVIADLRMPGMDGIQFLTRAKEVAPDTVRIMLTGHGDLSTAITAINEGNIFRFLTKPIMYENLIKAINGGIGQYRLITAERELLESTLNKSVRLLTDVLSLTNPEAFSRTLRIRKIVRHIVTYLRLYDTWVYDLAGMLSLIGCVVLPANIIEKVFQGKDLSKHDQSIYQSYPIIGYRLLADIPRLELVAGIIRDQQKSFSTYPSLPATSEMRKQQLGAQILKVALEYDRLIQDEVSHQDAVTMLANNERDYNPEVVQALGPAEILSLNWAAKLIDIKGASTGMVLAEDVYSTNGDLLVNKSQQITTAVLERLHLIAEGEGVVEPFRVLVPA
jgi:response regulator RpfG family c-di-GMP phosphodiesterase